MKNILTLSLLCLIVFAGIGCTQTSSLSAEEAASALSLQTGAEIIVRPTVFGVGGAIVEWLGSEENEWEVDLTSWSTAASVTLSWSVTSEVETDASKAAIYAYEQEYAETPIGVEIPDPPEPQYEEVVKSGSLASESLSNAQRLTLPEYWPEGDAGVQDSSLIWLSADQYNELVNTRATSISLGLFDESVMQAENAAETMQNLVDQFKGLFPGSEEGGDTEETTDALLDITTVNADGDWGTYTLTVNNVRTKVRTIEAENKFATYTILANPNNPIILEIKLSPLAQGTVQAFNPTNIASSFSGYEIIKINSVVSEETESI